MEFKDLKEFANLIKENCPEILRSCWKPVKSEEPSRSPHATKFGGSNPFRGTNFSWPRCGGEGCGKHKYFICQINLGELPDQVKTHIGNDSGLFQCFWCPNTDCAGGEDPAYFISRSYMIPSLQTLAAISMFETNANTDNLPRAIKTFVERTNEEFERMESDWDQREAEERYDEALLEEKYIETWEASEKKEIPYLDEITNNDKISEKVLAVPGIVEDVHVLYNVEFDEGSRAVCTPPLLGVKLAGYMAWFTEEMAYPTCPDCVVDMDVTFLRLDFDPILRYGWDDGAAYVNLCPGCGKPDMHCFNNP